MKRLAILGAGESGVGTAILAKKQGYDVFVELVACEHILELLFNYIADESLRVCTTNCERHFGKSVYLFAGIVLQKDVANLRSVAMTYNYIVIALYEVEKALASLVNI